MSSDAACHIRHDSSHFAEEHVLDAECVGRADADALNAVAIKPSMDATKNGDESRAKDAGLGHRSLRSFAIWISTGSTFANRSCCSRCQSRNSAGVLPSRFAIAMTCG